MISILIYIAAAFLLIGCIIGLVAAIEGFLLQKNKFQISFKADPEIKKKLRKYAAPALIFFLTGAIIMIIAITLGLK